MSPAQAGTVRWGKWAAAKLGWTYCRDHGGPAWQRIVAAVVMWRRAPLEITVTATSKGGEHK